MEYKNVEAFITVYEKGSFSTAAEALFITQPTLSNRIQRMENQLGVILFERSIGKRPLPTAAADNIYPLLKKSYIHMEEALQLLRKKQPDLSESKVSISIPQHMSDELVPNILAVLNKKFPHLKFIIKSGVSSKMLQELDNGDMDIAFAYSHPPDHQAAGYSIYPLTQIRTALVCDPDHALSKKSSLTVGQLRNENILFYNSALLTYQLVEQYLQNHGLKRNQSIEIQNMHWLKKMLKQRDSIAFLQEIDIRSELENGTLTELRVNDYAPPSTPVIMIAKNTIPDDLRETIIAGANRYFGG